MANPNFITREELLPLVQQNGVKLVDASWYLPAHNRNGFEEFQEARLPGAVHFDIDAISDKSTDLPHMLPSPEQFAEAVGKMGISENDDIVVYDGPGVFSSARAWWTFKIMGAKQVRILQGGIDGWKRAGLPLETGAPASPKPSTFNPSFDASRVKDIQQMIEKCETGEAIVIDARPADRFTGETPEPRPGIESGHIPGAKSLPFGQLFEGEAMKDKDTLLGIFSSVGIDGTKPVITSCGSGVTAAILTLGLESAGLADNHLYDGSWSEWGSEQARSRGAKIEKG